MDFTLQPVAVAVHLDEVLHAPEGLSVGQTVVVLQMLAVTTVHVVAWVVVEASTEQPTVVRHFSEVELDNVEPCLLTSKVLNAVQSFAVLSSVQPDVCEADGCGGRVGSGGGFTGGDNAPGGGFTGSNPPGGGFTGGGKPPGPAITG